MSDSNTVTDGSVVTMHYKLTLDGGEVVDSSEGNEPLAYLHGAQNIVPGLEKEITGKSVGDKFDVDVIPAEGYGERIDDAVQVVDRGAFPPDADLQAGMAFQAVDENQNPLMGRIEKIEGDQVTVDFNHVLAGQTLHFAVEIVGVRAATAEENEHGHPHGPGGVDH